MRMAQVSHECGRKFSSPVYGGGTAEGRGGGAAIYLPPPSRSPACAELLATSPANAGEEDEMLIEHTTE